MEENLLNDRLQSQLRDSIPKNSPTTDDDENERKRSQTHINTNFNNNTLVEFFLLWIYFFFWFLFRLSTDIIKSLSVCINRGVLWLSAAQYPKKNTILSKREDRQRVRAHNSLIKFHGTGTGL